MTRAGWDLIADKVQYNADKARYGSREAVSGAVETSRARHQQLALGDSQTITVNTRSARNSPTSSPRPGTPPWPYVTPPSPALGQAEAGKRRAADTSTGAVCTAGDEVQEAAQERQEPGIVMFLPNLRSEARAQCSAAMAAEKSCCACSAITTPDLENLTVQGVRHGLGPDGGPRPFQAPHPVVGHSTDRRWGAPSSQ